MRRSGQSLNIGIDAHKWLRQSLTALSSAPGQEKMPDSQAYVALQIDFTVDSSFG